MDILKAYKTGLISEMHQRGLISSDVVMYFHYYEEFIIQRDSKTFRESITCVAEKYRVSESTVKRAIAKIRD